MSKFQQAILKLSNLSPDQTSGDEEKSDMLQTIEQARKEMNQAKGFFDIVTEPEQVDQAIYALNAAEKKYVFFLKKAREAGYKVETKDIYLNM